MVANSSAVCVVEVVEVVVVVEVEVVMVTELSVVSSSLSPSSFSSSTSGSSSWSIRKDKKEGTEILSVIEYLSKVSRAMIHKKNRHSAFNEEGRGIAKSKIIKEVLTVQKIA